ncbi:MAG: formimidoylglutamate deiminase [Myxococcaceae bacterium]
MTTVFKPDLLYWEGKLRDDLALAVSDGGHVADVLRAPLPGLPIRLVHRALFPGMVNAHSHAFQRLIRGRAEYVASGRASDDFWSWRELMYRAATTLTPDELYIASRQAFLEMALAGITSVGEFHYLHHNPDGTPYEEPNELALQVIKAAREVGLRIALLRVGYARAGFNVTENPRQHRFIDPNVDSFLRFTEGLADKTRTDSRVSVGLAPHSVRAVPSTWLRALSEGQRVLHMHVAEQPKEIEACVAEHGKRPVELLSELGLLSPRFSAVHAVHLAPHEHALLKGATVVACPSTERNLGDGIVAADQLLPAGVHLALGSDSQATIDLLDEACQLESHLRLLRLRRAVLDGGEGQVDGLARRLFEMATSGGGRSLGLPVGTLTIGGPADFFTVDLRHPSLVGAARESLLANMVFGMERSAVREVAVQGQLIVQEGQHPLTQESGEAFSLLTKRVFS